MKKQIIGGFQAVVIPTEAWRRNPSKGGVISPLTSVDIIWEYPLTLL